MRISVQLYGIEGWVPAQALATGDALKGEHDLAFTTTLSARGACGDEATQLQLRFLSALSMNPTSSELLDDLAAFYVIALAGKAATGTDSTALIQQQAMLQNVEAR